MHGVWRTGAERREYGNKYELAESYVLLLVDGCMYGGSRQTGASLFLFRVGPFFFQASGCSKLILRTVFYASRLLQKKQIGSDRAQRVYSVQALKQQLNNKSGTLLDTTAGKEAI